MFYSYTRSEYKTYLIGFSSTKYMLQVLVAISQGFVAEKRHGAMQKLFIKKKEEKKKEMRKNGHMSEISKTMGT